MRRRQTDGVTINRNEYVHGDYNVICDRSGFKVKASDTQLEWNGLRVRKADWEQRQPQDFVKGRADRQTVPDSRPEQTDVFLSPGDVTPGDL